MPDGPVADTVAHQQEVGPMDGDPAMRESQTLTPITLLPRMELPIRWKWMDICRGRPLCPDAGTPCMRGCPCCLCGTSYVRARRPASRIR